MYRPVRQPAQGGQHHRNEGVTFSGIDKLIDRLETSSSVSLRLDTGRELRHAFFDYLAFTLVHLNHEEETALPASLLHLTDETLLAIRTEIQRSTPPDMFKEWLRWMLPAMTPEELRITLAQARDHAPAAAYQLMLDVGQQSVEPAKWGKAIA